MSNPPIVPLLLPDDDRAAAEGVAEPGVDDPVTVERDGERMIDPDIDDSQVDSAAADRLAAGAAVPAGRAGADSGAADAVIIDPEDESEIPDSSEMNDEPGVGPGRPRP
ncbi:MAG: hypothetical protein ACTH8F_09595 [Microbacterium sp.]|uniref:hypothetical protein n=1 Tax=Microbacterium sp. TaxID=51671 RepID=UPI003F9ADA9B